MKKVASIFLKIVLVLAALGLIGKAVASRLASDSASAAAAPPSHPPVTVTVKTLEPEKARVWT